MWCLILLGLCGRFQVSSSEIEHVSLYESMPAFLWEDSCTFIVDAFIADSSLCVMHGRPGQGVYGIRCYELLTGDISWEIDSLEAERFPVNATLDHGLLYTCVHRAVEAEEQPTPVSHNYHSGNRVEHYSLQCFDMNDGSLVSEFDAGSSPAMTPPLITDSRAVILSDDGLFCYELENGILLWVQELNDNRGNFVNDFRYARNSAGLSHDDQGILFVGLKCSSHAYPGTEWKNLFALSLDDGEVLWSAYQDNRVYSGPVAHDGGLFLYSHNTVIKYSIDNGEVIWETPFGSDLDTDLWLQPQLGSLQHDGRPFIFSDEHILIPHSGGGFSDSVDVLRLSDGVIEGSFGVHQIQAGMSLLKGSGNELFLLSTETIDRSTPHLTLRTFPGMERLWMYYLRASRFIAGEGFICALNSDSFMVFH